MEGWPVNDTSENIHSRMVAMMKQKSGRERMEMGASMFDAARALALHSLRGRSQAELPGLLFLRCYGADFSARKKKRIAAHLSMNSKRS